jgi:hypothetical protein
LNSLPTPWTFLEIHLLFLDFSKSPETHHIQNHNFSPKFRFLPCSSIQRMAPLSIQVGRSEMVGHYLQSIWSYTLKTQNSTQKLLDTINSYSKVAGYKINIEKSLAFYTLTMNKLKKNIWKQFHLQ